MSISSRGLALTFTLAALCLGGQTAHAQVAAVPYWTPSWPLGFGGSLPAGSNWLGPRDNGATRTNFPNGWFIGGEGGGTGLSLNGLNQVGAFSSFPSLYYQGTQVGYNFQNAPLSVYAGFDTLKYNPGNFGPLTSFDSTSSTLPVYSAHAGIEYRPASNVSLSLGVGFTQQTGSNSDINSLAAPGVSPFAFGRR